jgi:hypothetical protein
MKTSFRPPTPAAAAEEEEAGRRRTRRNNAGRTIAIIDCCSLRWEDTEHGEIKSQWLVE